MEKYGWMIVLGYLLLVNLVGFVIMMIDKNRARNNQWRIRERTIFLCGAFGGSIGVWLGMRRFRHKTKHMKFVIGIPAIFILQCVLLLVIYIKVLV